MPMPRCTTPSRAGRATVRFFDPELARESYRNLVLEGELAQAVQRGEFVLHYEPQVRARDGVLVGAEALIRWQHPQRGLLAPDDFIPLAEQRRLMLPIGQWVLAEAIGCARRWQDGPLAGVPVAVNLSSLQFQAPGFVDGVRRVLAEHGLPGSLLELELTERMLMSDLEAVKDTLAPLKALGIRISVDDFGTGYSSLGHLKELPIDKLKVDHSFVRDLPEQTDSAAIARAIIQMGRSLGMTVIAEGVERAAQRDFLAREGCDMLQGAAIGAALAAPAFERQWGVRAGGTAGRRRRALRPARPQPGLGVFCGRFQVGRLACRARATVSCPAGASRPMVEPAPIVAPSPIVTGATSTQLLPTCTSAPIVVRCLFTPS